MTDTSSSPQKAFTGSCHCGFVRYEAVLPIPSPPEHPTAGRCNCTICLKSSFTGIHITPQDFTLRSPASFDEIPDYQFNSKDVHKYFCRTCGVHVCWSGKYDYGGKVVEFFRINLLTLDQPQEGLNVSKWKIMYTDGRNNNWHAGTKDVPWAGGSV